MRHALAALTVLALACGPTNPPPSAGISSDKPNIVFFLVDDLGQRDVGC